MGTSVTIAVTDDKSNVVTAADVLSSVTTSVNNFSFEAP